VFEELDEWDGGCGRESGEEVDDWSEE